VRVLELEKEIGTMRTNHENVVAVLRATNKQHAANVLELRAQVSALADGNSYLQRQLSLKSTQLHELKQNERQSEQDRSELQTKLQERHTKILQLEEEMTALQAQMKRSGGEKESVLVHMQREFQARQRRDREQIKALRDEVVALVNARNALRAELQDAKETSFFFF
jgi:chromosome segregation ATPase